MLQQLTPDNEKALQLLDDVSTCFFETNMFSGVNQLLQHIMSNQICKQIIYQRCSKSWLATVKLVHGPHSNIVCVSLYFDSHEFPNDQGTGVDGWIQIDNPLCFNNTKNVLLQAGYSKCRTFAHWPKKSVDITFSNDDPTLPWVNLFFEPGFPYVDDEFPWEKL